MTEISARSLRPVPISRSSSCRALPASPISLSAKTFVDEQVKQRGYGTSSEYVRELIRKDQERTRLRGLLLEGTASQPIGPAEGAYFDGLRNRIRCRGKR